MNSHDEMFDYFCVLNARHIRENYDKYKINENLDPIGMEENINHHLHTIYNEPLVIDKCYNVQEYPSCVYLNKTLNAYFFIKSVLKLNNIYSNKWNDILVKYMQNKDELLFNFLENLKENLIIQGTRSIYHPLYEFSSVLFMKETSILEQFCKRYFSFCILKNDPLLIFQLPLVNVFFWEGGAVFEDVFDKLLIIYINKTENFKKKLVNYLFEKEEKIYSTHMHQHSFSRRLDFLSKSIKSYKIYELFWELLFEKAILEPFLDNIDFVDFYQTIFNLHSNYSKNIESKSVNQKRYSKLMELYNYLPKHQEFLAELSEQRLILVKTYFNQKVPLLLKCWSSKYYKQDFEKENVTIICMKKSFIHMHNEEINQDIVSQNTLIKTTLSNCVSLNLEAANENERFLKEYNFDNLIFLSTLTSFVIETPFSNPFEINSEIKSTLNLHLNFHEYLFLSCFQETNTLYFEILKGRFYKLLDFCDGTKTHNDDNSQGLLKTTYKKFYEQSFMVSLENEKRLKWNSFLSLWRKSFETNNFGSLRVTLITKPSKKLNKINYILDESLEEYVYKL